MLCVSVGREREEMVIRQLQNTEGRNLSRVGSRCEVGSGRPNVVKVVKSDEESKRRGPRRRGRVSRGVPGLPAIEAEICAWEIVSVCVCVTRGSAALPSM